MTSTQQIKCFLHLNKNTPGGLSLLRQQRGSPQYGLLPSWYKKSRWMSENCRILDTGEPGCKQTGKYIFTQIIVYITQIKHKLSKTHFLVTLIIVLPIIPNCVADLQVSAPVGSCNEWSGHKVSPISAPYTWNWWIRQIENRKCTKNDKPISGDHWRSEESRHYQKSRGAVHRCTFKNFT